MTLRPHPRTLHILLFHRALAFNTFTSNGVLRGEEPMFHTKAIYPIIYVYILINLGGMSHLQRILQHRPHPHAKRAAERSMER